MFLNDVYNQNFTLYLPSMPVRPFRLRSNITKFSKVYNSETPLRQEKTRDINNSIFHHSKNKKIKLHIPWIGKIPSRWFDCRERFLRDVNIFNCCMVIFLNLLKFRFKVSSFFNIGKLFESTRKL